jgi:hypothetical protein
VRETRSCYLILGIDTASPGEQTTARQRFCYIVNSHSCPLRQARRERSFTSFHQDEQGARTEGGSFYGK